MKQITDMLDWIAAAMLVNEEEGVGGGLSWKKDYRSLSLFKRGDQLQ